MMLTVEGAKRGKICNLLFVRVIKPFVEEESFFPEVLYAFKIQSRAVAPPRKFNITNSRMSPNFNEMNWFAFFKTVGSMSHLLTRMGSN